MATQWSDHFAAAQPGLTRDSERRAGAGIGHGRVRYKRANVTLDLAPDDFAIGDVARLMTFKSSDRLFELFVSADGASTALTADLGLYQAGVSGAHDGAVIDADLFASALALNGAVARVDEFEEATTLTEFHRGLTLWEIAAIGEAAYTVDPFLDFDLAFTCTADILTADENVVVEAFYTSGD